MSSRSSSSSLEVERRPAARQPQMPVVQETQPQEQAALQKVQEIQNNSSQLQQASYNNQHAKYEQQKDDRSKKNHSRSSSRQKDEKKNDKSSNYADKRDNKEKKEYRSRNSRSRSPNYRSRREDDDRKYRDNKDSNRDRNRRDNNCNSSYHRNKNEREFHEDKVYKNKEDRDQKDRRNSLDRNNKKNYKSYRDDRRRSRSRDSKDRYKNSRNDKKYNRRDDDSYEEKKLDIRQNADDMYGKKYDKKSNKEEEEEQKPEENTVLEKPCWTPSGILAQYQNNVNGVTLKFTKPLDAEKPKENWSLYPFKGDEKFDVIRLKGDSAFLVGKDPRVCYILCENSSVSSQHAVIQFRDIKQMDYGIGQYTSIIRPYIMDLESTNGTLLNNEKIEPAKYIQLLPKDVLKFGFSQREYVLMKEN
ncbi:hypothetical protein ABPG72_014927 [Tetrahymena utriculariae]